MQPWWHNALSGWDSFWSIVKQQSYFHQLNQTLLYQYAHFRCYPSWNEIGRLFTLVNPLEIKVVILGQDPYFRGQADGIAFSASHSFKTPPSLRNIFAELQADCGIEHQNRLNLAPWVQQGVFLMNTIWTVQADCPLSHAHYGWEQFSAELIRWLTGQNQQIIFCFWGKKALKYKQFLAPENPFLVHAHPSPLSYRLFRGSKPFSRLNSLLQHEKQIIIDWAQ